MSSPNVLFVANSRDYLREITRMLESDGFRVWTATDPNAALDRADVHRIDVAVIDLPLINERDECAALQLAERLGGSVPKIILTRAANLALMRNALGRRGWCEPLATDFIAKEEGPSVLIRALRDAVRPEVLVIAGNDDGARFQLVCLVEKLGLRARMLPEQANGVRAIIDAFDVFARVAFAVVLLPPDDLGRSVTPKQRQHAAAHQNVVFELGYLAGKLGRGYVAALHRGRVELPADLHGVACVDLDRPGGWENQLLNAMRAAGLKVDAKELRLRRLPARRAAAC